MLRWSDNKLIEIKCYINKMNTIFKNSNVPRDFNLFIFSKMSYNFKVEKLANIKKFEFQTFHVALQVTKK